MKIDAYSILIVLSVLVVISYLFNYLSGKLKIPSVLLLIGSGVGLKYMAEAFHLNLPQTQTLLEILGVTGLIFIVLEASLDLKIERAKLTIIGRAFLSAFVLLFVTAGLMALIFTVFYQTNFKQALIHAIPLSIISSAIAIPSVSSLEQEKKEFVIYESTFSDILGIIAFNYLLSEHSSGLAAIVGFSRDLILIFIISIFSTGALLFLLNHATTSVRFFLTFAIIILTYSIAKYYHLPSLVLVLCFGVVLNNFRLFDFPIVRRLLSFEKLNDVSRELKMMTSETAFVIRTFFFLLFGYSINLLLLASKDVILVGFIVMGLIISLRFIFLKYLLRVNSTALTLIAPRGLITILLFYGIPASQRLEALSEGVLFIVIVFTGLMMTVGLLTNRANPNERVEDVI